MLISLGIPLSHRGLSPHKITPMPGVHQRLKLTGAAILVFRASTSFQAARQLSLDVELNRSADEFVPRVSV